ncbi:hypothetical protein HpMS68_03360 [Helicobacter pylori]
MPKLVKWNKFRIKCWLIKMDQGVGIKKIEWNEKQRKAFQDLLREFVALIDAKVQEGKQMGKKPKIPKHGSCQKGLNKFLTPGVIRAKSVLALGTYPMSHQSLFAVRIF